jgi:hypothetical protein
MRHICWLSVTKVPICKDAYDHGETYEKRKPRRGVIPNGLRIAAFGPLSSVQLLGCHCDVSSFGMKRTEQEQSSGIFDHFMCFLGGDLPPVVAGFGEGFDHRTYREQNKPERKFDSTLTHVRLQSYNRTVLMASAGERK